MVRKVTNRILEEVESGILDKDQVLLACLTWMSEHDVSNMADANCFFEHDEEEEEKECCSFCGEELDLEDVQNSEEGKPLCFTCWEEEGL